MLEETAVRPRPRPTPRRVPKRHQEDTVDVAELARQNQALLERIEQLESRTVRHVESETPPKVIAHEANPESLSDFQRSLLTKTHPVPTNYGGDREPGYNVPLRWYLRPDGRFVQLQGDAKNRAYYVDKGFHVLSADEEAEYLQKERPKQVQVERTRAALINGLRQLVRRENTLSGYVDDQDWDEKLADLTVDQLEDEWRSLCRQTPNPNRRLPMAERHRRDQDATDAKLMAGVETKPPRAAVDALEQVSAHQPRSRLIPVTARNAAQFTR